LRRASHDGDTVEPMHEEENACAHVVSRFRVLLLRRMRGWWIKVGSETLKISICSINA